VTDIGFCETDNFCSARGGVETLKFTAISVAVYIGGGGGSVK
jgi:hypothetical protein